MNRESAAGLESGWAVEVAGAVDPSDCVGAAMARGAVSRQPINPADSIRKTLRLAARRAIGAIRGLVNSGKKLFSSARDVGVRVMVLDLFIQFSRCIFITQFGSAPRDVIQNGRGQFGKLMLVFRGNRKSK
jgi:hypothetical protein